MSAGDADGGATQWGGVPGLGGNHHHERMTPSEPARPTTEFPTRMGKVAPRELALHGYTRYDQLTSVTATELLRIHGVGPKAIRILSEELIARGLTFADG